MPQFSTQPSDGDRNSPRVFQIVERVLTTLSLVVNTLLRKGTGDAHFDAGDRWLQALDGGGGLAAAQRDLLLLAPQRRSAGPALRPRHRAEGAAPGSEALRLRLPRGQRVRAGRGLQGGDCPARRARAA